MSQKSNYLFKIVLLTLVITDIMGRGVEGKIKTFMILLLFVLLNLQLRTLFSNEKIVLLSVFIDFVLIFIFYRNFHGLSYMFLFITLVDGISYLRKYIYAVCMMVGGGIIYLTYSSDRMFILTNIFIYFSLILYNCVIMAQQKKKRDLEYLYDDVRRYSYELEDAKKQIEMYSKQVEYLTQIKERNRISEEIHDTIGHRLTALLMQLEAGVRLLHTKEEMGLEFLGNAIVNLRESIDVLRNTVHSMEDQAYKSLMSSIEDLIRKLKIDTGVKVDLRIEGDRVKLSPGVETIVYKNIQESLTNAMRHAQARTIRIVIRYQTLQLIVRIENDGVVTRNLQKGMGLKAMEERLKYIGGSMRVDDTDLFVVENIIPLKQLIEVV